MFISFQFVKNKLLSFCYSNMLSIGDIIVYIYSVYLYIFDQDFLSINFF